MDRFSRFDLLSTSIWAPVPFSLFPDPEMAVVDDPLAFALDILNPNPSPFDLLPYSPPSPSPLDLFFESTAVDLASISSFGMIRRFREKAQTDLYLRSLSDRVAALELGLGLALAPKGVDRKYKWTTEIKGPGADGFDRKYKVVALAKGGEERDLKWTAEIKGKGRDAAVNHTYTFQASTAEGKGKGKGKEKKEKEKEKEKKKGSDAAAPRVVEIEEKNPGAIVIRKAFAKGIIDRSKGKRKELSKQDAALIIQMTFRAYLVRRSQVVRGLRDLAVAKAKLKEIRALFHNLFYRRRIVNDAEERQRFSEKIIVLLLTVDAIEGPDYMVRAARKLMVEELEAMLEVVDPQKPGMLGSMKRRQFDLPAGGPISKEMAMGVSGVIQMLNEEDHESNGIPNGST